MPTLTIRLPDDKHNRLKLMAQRRKISVNKLIDELATIAIGNHDARLRFDERAARGKPRRALKLLEGLGDA